MVNTYVYSGSEYESLYTVHCMDCVTYLILMFSLGLNLCCSPLNEWKMRRLCTPMH